MFLLELIPVNSLWFYNLNRRYLFINKSLLVATINWDDLQYEKTTYYTLKSYGQSKLAQILNSFELSKRLKATGVTAVSLHPGFVATDIFRSRGQDATG